MSVRFSLGLLLALIATACGSPKPETNLNTLIRPEEAAKVLQVNSVAVSASGTAVQGQRSLRYDAANGRSLTATFFFDKGRASGFRVD
jgi:hypothetical protein